jgi:hypothetical protein
MAYVITSSNIESSIGRKVPVLNNRWKNEALTQIRNADITVNIHTGEEV